MDDLVGRVQHNGGKVGQETKLHTAKAGLQEAAEILKVNVVHGDVGVDLVADDACLGAWDEGAAEPGDVLEGEEGGVGPENLLGEEMHAALGKEDAHNGLGVACVDDGCEVLQHAGGADDGAAPDDEVAAGNNVSRVGAHHLKVAADRGTAHDACNIHE